MPRLVATLVLAEMVYGGQTQTPPAEPNTNFSFEAASVKPSKTYDGVVSRFAIEPNRLDIQHMDLKFLIKQAYDLRDDQISGPDSLVEHAYDIVATTGAPVSRASMRVMLRNLLVERFQLTTHWETRTSAVYRLLVLPSGPKMKTAEQEYASPNSPMLDHGAEILQGPMSMPQLAETLARVVRKPVIDTTRLDGYFDFKLIFANNDYDGPLANNSPASVLTDAVREQLGLKLAPGREPIRILIVDHADVVPVPN
jgi:uncharacterized protein (TIGR03435 family)